MMRDYPQAWKTSRDYGTCQRRGLASALKEAEALLEARNANVSSASWALRLSSDLPG